MTTRSEDETVSLGRQRRLGRPTLQDLLDGDARPVPEILRRDSFTEDGPGRISTSCFTSSEFHHLEVDRVWKKVWQMACLEQEIPNVGDTHIYEIARLSILVTRVAPDEIKAFYNACLHRGTVLCTENANLSEFRCRFHGFAWELDGSFKGCPQAWDFPGLDPAQIPLPEVKVETWEGFVFINLDPDCAPLADYLGGVADHFAEARPRLGERWKAAHVAKPIRANWKVVLEAFIEAMHVPLVHPQAMLFGGDASAQYDTYPGERHWARLCDPVGVPCSLVNDTVSEQAIAEAIGAALPGANAENITVPAGGTARAVMADVFRDYLRNMTGFDASEYSETEVLDGWEYWVFPNFCPWFTVGNPLVYRFRPYGDDPDMSIMDVIVLMPKPEGAPDLPAMPVHWLTVDDSWTAAAELGPYGEIFDQDLGTVPLVQQGLHTMQQPEIHLSRYQESLIRRFHSVLEEYITSG